MMEWWYSLEAVNQWFFVAAAFFSVFFLWQLIAAMVGLGGEHGDADAHADVHVDADMAVHADMDAHADFDAAHDAYEHFEHGAVEDADATMAAFKLLSIRSVLAFFTLFTWAGALYLSAKLELGLALIYATLWGLGSMLAVAMVFHFMRRMTETGTLRLATCVGTAGMVYLNIPAGGLGEAKVTVSGVVSHVKARGIAGEELSAGTRIRVVRLLDAATIEVEPLSERPAGKDQEK